MTKDLNNPNCATPFFRSNMATLTAASDANKAKVTAEKVVEVVSDIGLNLPHLDQWHEIIASVQESIDIVESMPDYFPVVDLEKYPRRNVHRPSQEKNEGNAWAWKATIEGEKGGPLSGVTICLKDNIAVKDVPMLLGTDIFTDYTPKTDASMCPTYTLRIA